MSVTKKPLGRSGLDVTEFCLGTMTFGNQTDEATAHAQIEHAAAAGLNFMDAAEMYPVNPVRAETVGRTEEILGNWFAKSGKRHEWIVATKVSGAGLAAVRDGAPISPATMTEALESSLKRLQTDVIDLYQLALAQSRLLRVPPAMGLCARDPGHRRDAPAHGRCAGLGAARSGSGHDPCDGPVE